MSSDSNYHIVEDAKDVANNIASKPIWQDAKHDAQHTVDKINSQPIVQDAKNGAKDVANKVDEKAGEVKEQARDVAENINSQPIVQDAKAGAREAADKAKHAADKASEAAAEASDSALIGLKKVDQTILRLNKLLASPGGLSAFLSTFNYSLYILAYLQTKSAPLTAFATRILALVRPAYNDTKLPATTLLNPAGVPPIAALAVLVSKARTTLRLFGLFPLYAWLRQLVKGPKAGSDVVLHRIALLQASSYATYQALENISLLADSGVVPPTFVARLNKGVPTTPRLYLYAYRAWLGGVSCDFLRLAREWQLENKRRTTRKMMRADGRELSAYQADEDAKFDKRWWTDLMIAGAWLPMALHFSSVTGGVPGWNLGWMGVCGMVAGSTRVKALWASTA